MTTNGWERGVPPDFWMEENPPTGIYDYYVFDHLSEIGSAGKHDLLLLLAALGVIEYGTVYESIDCIRIKVRK